MNSGFNNISSNRFHLRENLSLKIILSMWEIEI